MTALIVVTASAAVVAGVLVTRGGSAVDRSTEPEFATPCMGTEVPVDAARDTAAFELIEPQTPLANSAGLESTWVCTTTWRGIALVYDSGIMVLESVNDLKEPEATWQRMAELYPEFSVEAISGIPISVADPAVDDAIGGADFVIGEVRYRVSGNGEIPLDDLMGVAKSLVTEATR